MVRPELPACERDNGPALPQWKDEQGRVWRHKKELPKNNANPQANSNQAAEASGKSAIEWDDFDGNTWRS
eukprot:13779392-Heterocapsa_arctica.AAC.1